MPNGSSMAAAGGSAMGEMAMNASYDLSVDAMTREDMFIAEMERRNRRELPMRRIAPTVPAHARLFLETSERGVPRTARAWRSGSRGNTARRIHERNGSSPGQRACIPFNNLVKVGFKVNRRQFLRAAHTLS